MVGIKLTADADGQMRIDQRFVILEALNLNAFNRDFRVLGEHLPGSRGMHVIKQHDFADFIAQLVLQIVQRGAQVIWVRVFTVNCNDGILTFLQKMKNIVFD